MTAQRIAVLGGGITGLSAAFHLSRQLPSSSVTVIEGATRLGGWIRSERVDVRSSNGQEGSVVLEAGPRTLRPNSKSLLELINLLSLSNQLVLTPKSSPAAKNRFLHIPGKDGLTPLPASLSSVFTSPLAPLLVSSVAREPFRRRISPYNDPSDQHSLDDSLDGLLTRRFGAPFARTLGSALVHGIYAADSRMLSVRAAFPTLLEAEQRGRGSIVQGFFTPKAGKPSSKDYDIGNIEQIMNDVSVYSFRDGLTTLVNGLHRYLSGLPNVQMRTGVKVSSLEFNSNDVSLNTSNGPLDNITHVVSALPLPTLSRILPPSTTLPHLNTNPSSSVVVLNLIFPGAPFHPPGFGYLIPRPMSAYEGLDSSHPGILGVVFDSCALSEQDTISSPSPGGIFTKLTVMLGGPYSNPSTSVPAILSHLRTHLGLAQPLPEPVYAKMYHHEDCIPIPTVGHVQRMVELRAALGDAPWNGRLEVVGAGVGGVSVGDCVEAGRNVALRWA